MFLTFGDRLSGFLIALSCCAVAAAGCGDETTPVLLLTIDALRADHLSTYGYERETDPNIAAIAEDGVVFTRAFTTVPKTTPAYASMFTGLYPHRHGLRMLGQELAPENTTLAEMLRTRGYRTAGFVSSTVMLARLSGLNQGFDVWDDYLPARAPHRVNYERSAADTGRATREWLERAESPFFVFVHLIDPHGPYRPPGTFRRRFTGGQGTILKADQVPEFQRLPGARTVADYANAYDGEIAYADAILGEIVQRLRDSGLYDRTLIIVTADHGESLGEDGYYFRHGKTLREVSTRVPLIVKPPHGRFPGLAQFRHETVSLVDIVPTVLDYVGARRAESSSVDGFSLRPAVEGVVDRGDRVVFSQREGRGRIRRAAHGRYGSYLHTPCAPGEDPSACGSEFLPVGSTSTGESQLRARRSRLAAKLAEFDEYSRNYRRSFRTRWRYRPGDEAFVEQFVSRHNSRWRQRHDNDLEALRSLGYVE